MCLQPSSISSHNLLLCDESNECHELCILWLALSISSNTLLTAEKDQKHYEEMFQQYSKAMDDLKNSLNVVNTRLEHSQTEINDGNC